MRIALINPPLWHYMRIAYTYNPTVGLPTLGAVLERAGHEVEIVDAEALQWAPERVAAYVAGYQFDAVGVTGCTMSRKGAAETVAALRVARPDLYIAVGGVHATLNAQEPLTWGADCTVTGEAESNVAVIFEQQPKGVVSGGLPPDMESLPAPAWHQLALKPINTYPGNSPKLGHPEGILMTARGCPHACLTADTLIQLADGSTLPIKDVQAGMMVWGADNLNNVPRLQMVRASMQTSPCRYDIIAVEVEGAPRLTCTSDHLIWTKRMGGYGWVEAGHLNPGDEVLLYVRNGQAQTQVYDDRRGSTAPERDGAAVTGRREVAPQAANVGGRESAASSSADKPRGASEVYCWTESPRSASRACRTDPATEPRRATGPQDIRIGRGATSQQRADETAQPNGACGSTREGAAGVIVSAGDAFRANQTATRRRADWRPSPMDRRAESSAKPTHEGEQPHEAGRCGGQSGTTEALAQHGRPEGSSSSVDSCRSSAEWCRAATAGDNRPFGISLCGRRQVLDRTLPERALSESRLCVQDREEADRPTDERRILAPAATGTGRSDRDGRLHQQGLADACDLGEGTQEPCSGAGQGQGLARWTRVLQVTPLPDGQAVYDLETTPDHSFFANGILVHNCVFCGNALFSPRPWRPRPVTAVVDELEVLRKRWGVNSVFIYDDEFVGMNARQQGWLVELAYHIRKRGLHQGLTIKAQGRCSSRFIDDFTLQELRSMAEQVCVMWGVESWSNKVLRAVRKGTTTEMIWHTLRTAKAAGLLNWLFLMVGNLDEGPAECEETVAGLRQALQDGLVDFRQVTICSPQPGTEMWARAEREGWLVEQPLTGAAMHEAYGPTPWLTVEQMRHYQSVLEAMR